MKKSDPLPEMITKEDQLTLTLDWRFFRLRNKYEMDKKRMIFNSTSCNFHLYMLGVPTKTNIERVCKVSILPHIIHTRADHKAIHGDQNTIKSNK